MNTQKQKKFISLLNTPQNTLYYKIKDEKIEIRKIQILTIFDNRQNPDKLKI